MKLNFYFKKLQLFNEQQQPIYYDGINPNSLEIIQGLIPNNEWVDMTNYVDDTDKLNLSWRLKEDGSSGKGASNIDKGVGGELLFTDKAYKYIKHWLNDHVASPLNGIEVKIETDNGAFTDWVIKADGLKYCDNDTCTIETSLRQKEDLYSCIQRTLITDNHSGMFSGSYEHPRMAYCDEFRPVALLVALFMTVGMVSVVALVLTLIVSAIKNVLLAITYAFQWIRAIRRLRKQIQAIPDIGDVIDLFVQILINISGCNREHPAPLIRDYISNVCSKCGISVTEQSVPIFFNPQSDYYNLTMLSADVNKGIHQDHAQPYWIPENDPILTLDMLLDKLKPVFNAEWKIKGTTLYFDRHDKDDLQGFVYDFKGSEKNKIIEGICYTWNETKKRAYGRFGYALDPMDKVGNDAQSRFNDVVEFNKPINPMLEGEGNYIVQDFGATKFRQDGINEDYIAQALSYMWIIHVLSLGTTKVIFNTFETRISYKKGALVISSDTIGLPKLIIWDGREKRNAKAKYWHTFNQNPPSQNPQYNTDRQYNQVHDVVEYDNHYKENNHLYNYPMAFDANFLGNLYDRFHQIEDPRINPPMNKSFELKIPLCSDDLTRLGLFNDSTNNALGRYVKLDAGQYFQQGKITEIEASFDPKDRNGRYIKIKGKV